MYTLSLNILWMSMGLAAVPGAAKGRAWDNAAASS
jgi:hypothetical protein